MNMNLMNLLQDEKTMGEFLKEANKYAEENSQNHEAAIKKLQGFWLSKGIEDCSVEDVKEVLSLIKDITEKTEDKNMEALTESEIEDVVGGCLYGSEYFEYKKVGKYWKKLIRNIALYTTAAVGACSLIIGGTVIGVKKLSK